MPPENTSWENIAWSCSPLTPSDQIENLICLYRVIPKEVVVQFLPGKTKPCAMCFESKYNALLYLDTVRKNSRTDEPVKLISAAKINPNKANMVIGRPLVIICPQCRNYLVYMQSPGHYVCNNCHLTVDLQRNT